MQKSYVALKRLCQALQCCHQILQLCKKDHLIFVLILVNLTFTKVLLWSGLRADLFYYNLSRRRSGYLPQDSTRRMHQVLSTEVSSARALTLLPAVLSFLSCLGMLILQPQVKVTLPVPLKTLRIHITFPQASAVLIITPVSPSMRMVRSIQ